MGGELRFTSPDRSWCRTTSSGTHENGDTDAQLARDALWPEHLGGGARKSFEEKKVRGSTGGDDAGGGLGNPPLTRAAPFRSAALRATGASLKKTWRKLNDPLDNPHRRCSAWLGINVFM